MARTKSTLAKEQGHGEPRRCQTEDGARQGKGDRSRIMAAESDQSPECGQKTENRQNEAQDGPGGLEREEGQVVEADSHGHIQHADSATDAHQKWDGPQDDQTSRDGPETHRQPSARETQEGSESQSGTYRGPEVWALANPRHPRLVGAREPQAWPGQDWESGDTPDPENDRGDFLESNPDEGQDADEKSDSDPRTRERRMKWFKGRTGQRG